MNGQWTGVNHFVESLFRASGLGQYATEDMLRQRLRELDDELVVFKQRRAFLENPIRELERLLREQGSDSLYIEIVARGERERLGSRRTGRESLFKAIIEHHGATKGFLEAMLRTWGQWTPVGDQIQFDSATTQNTYRTYFQRVQSASSVVNAAMAQL